MTTISPPRLEKQSFTDPEKAWDVSGGALSPQHQVSSGGIWLISPRAWCRTAACGRAIRRSKCAPTSYSKTESTLPYGFLHTPGLYRTTVTAPDLFRTYYQEQFTVILKNHGGTIDIAESDTPIPLHFAVKANERIDGEALNALNIPLRDVFDAPDLGNTDDEIANGTFVPPRGGPYRWPPSRHRAWTIRCSGSAPLYRHRCQPFPELRDFHQLRLLHRRVLPHRQAVYERWASPLRKASSSRAMW